MQQFLVVGKGGLKRVIAEKVDANYIIEVVGTGAPQNYLEVVGQRFHDPKIIIYINEEGRVYNLPVYGVLKTTNESLCGHFVVCSSTEDGLETGLTDEQIEIVLAQLEVIPEGLSALPSPIPRVIGFNSEEEFLRATHRISNDLYEATRLRT